MSRDGFYIIYYHGISNTRKVGKENFLFNHLYYEDFCSQMRYLRENFNVLSLSAALNSRFSGRNNVVVTFDDGYQNILKNAAPVLTDLKIPATFFVCPGFIEANCMNFRDQVEFCIAHSRKDKIKLRLNPYSKNPSVKIYSLTNKNKKMTAIATIKDYLRTSNNETIHYVLDQLIYETDVYPNFLKNPEAKMMNWRQLRELSTNKLFSVGGHGLYHEVLPALSNCDLELALSTSIKFLSNKLNKKIQYYSYPLGKREHFDKRTLRILNKDGLKAGLSTINGINYRDSNPFCLKRVKFNDLID